MANEDVKVRRRKLSDYARDPHNPNKGSERSRTIIRESLLQDGPARSAVASEDDVLLIGNQTAGVAEDAGITDVIEITPPPNTLVVVKRSDVRYGDEKARRLRVADNRSQDFHAYDLDALELDAVDGLLDGLFRDDELLDLQLDAEIDRDVNAVVNAASEDDKNPTRLNRAVPAKQIKPVLYIDQLDVFERALRQTGILNRGDALTAICQFYLEQAPPKN